MKVTVSSCVLLFIFFALHEECAAQHANRRIVLSTDRCQVNVYKKNGTDDEYGKICGGTLVSYDVIISAAHCFYDETHGRVLNASDFMVTAGERQPHNETYVQKSSVKRIDVPGRYSGRSGNYAFDIALVRILIPFEQTSVVQKFPPIWNVIFKLQGDQPTQKIKGWKETETGERGPELQENDYETYGSCSATIKTYFGGSLPEDKFCDDLHTRSSRRSDVGGRGLYDFTQDQNGTVFGGVISVTPDSDKVVNTHVVFTNVSYHLNWIRAFFPGAKDPAVKQIECTLPEQPKDGRYEVRSCSGQCNEEPETKVPQGYVLHYHFECKEGYFLEENGTRICENDGWTEVPRCVKRGHITGGETVRVNLNETAILSCSVEGDPVKDFRWMKIEDSVNDRKLENGAMDETKQAMTLNLTRVARRDNGSYECSARDYKSTIRGRTFLVVTEVPAVRIELATPDRAGSVYLKWTVRDGNEPLTALSIQHKKNDTNQWTDNPEEISANVSSYVVKGLDTKTRYDFRITATNSVGKSQPAIADAITSGTARVNGMGVGIAVSGVILALLPYS